MNEGSKESVLEKIREKLASSERVVVLTGAGISAESGVPTFRGAGGLWRQYNATDLATPEAFAADPQLVWEFYNWRRELLAPLNPNPGHFALAELQKRIRKLTLVTQNIDGLHQTSGSIDVRELHGNIWWLRCTGCGVKSEDRRVPLPRLPKCPACGALLRPDVVWFGEMLDSRILNKVYEEIQSCRLMLVVGTSGTVQPAASMGMLARQGGATVVEINIEATPFSEAYDLSVTGKSGEILPLLLQF